MRERQWTLPTNYVAVLVPLLEHP